jgi:hypothetical protein
MASDDTIVKAPEEVKPSIEEKVDDSLARQDKQETIQQFL